MKRSVVLGLALLVGFGTTSRAQRLPREVAVWYNDGWDDESHARYQMHHHMVSEVSPYWYDLGDVQLEDGSIHERAYAYDRRKIEEIHANGDLVIPSIADRSEGQVDRVLKNATARQALTDNLVALVQKNDFDGIAIDFERGTPAARELFTLFVTDLAHRLHAVNKTLAVVVKPVWSLKQEQKEMVDRSALAATGVDRIKIMVYDHNFEHGRNTPGPIAPVKWIREVLDYAVGRGVPSAKIQIAIHSYGWTWREVGPDKYELQLPIETHESLVAKLGHDKLEWDAEAEESYIHWEHEGERYITYIGDARTMKARLALADSYPVAGLAIWVAGRDDAGGYAELCAFYGGWCAKPLPNLPYPTNVALRRNVTGSAAFDDFYVPTRGVDGYTKEGFLADPTDKVAFLSVDLTRDFELVEARIHWGKHDYATRYRVEVSRDGKTWQAAALVEGGDGGIDTIDLLGLATRFVRVVCLEKNDWSYEIYELVVIGMHLPAALPPNLTSVVDQTPPPEAIDGNLARNKQATATSTFDGFYTADKAVNNNDWLGWLADPTEAVSALTVDLGEVADVGRAVIHWGKYDWPATYAVEVSTDGKSFTTAYETAEGDGGTDEVSFSPAAARYVRVVCLEKVDWSYEIYELGVYR